MIEDIFIDIIKTATLTIVWSKGLKVFGKKEYGEIIKLSGVSVCGIDLMELVNYWRKNPPFIVKMVKGTSNFFHKIDATGKDTMEKIDKFNKTLQFFIERGKVK